MEAGHHGRHRRERVLLAEDGVGRRDRGLGHQQAVVHVAEVEEPRDRARQRARVAHDHVVVVGVAVDHLPPQPRQRGDHLALEALERPPRERAPRGVGHALERRRAARPRARGPTGTRAARPGA